MGAFTTKMIDSKLLSFKFDSDKEGMILVHYDGKKEAYLEKITILDAIATILEGQVWYDEKSSKNEDLNDIMIKTKCRAIMRLLAGITHEQADYILNSCRRLVSQHSKVQRIKD